MRLSAAVAIAAAALLGVAGQRAEAQNQQVENPYSPAYGHPYRHGAAPTIDAWSKMKQWWAAHPASGESTPATSGSGGIMTFQGGVNGIGVVSGVPKVYLVFWGSQWINGGDPNGAATYLQHFYAGIGTGGETWSGTMTQYCDGPNVATGASSCPSAAPHVGYPSSGALASVWFDDSAPVPTDATQTQIAAEAVAAAAHFGNTSAASNRYAQYVIAFPSGADPDGFPMPPSVHGTTIPVHRMVTSPILTCRTKPTGTAARTSSTPEAYLTASPSTAGTSTPRLSRMSSPPEDGATPHWAATPMRTATSAPGFIQVSRVALRT